MEVALEKGLLSLRRAMAIAIARVWLGSKVVFIYGLRWRVGERHELLGKWKSRLTMAGFRQYPLSSYMNSVIRSLLRCYSKHYNLVEKDGAMLLGWKDRNLISTSAWY